MPLLATLFFVLAPAVMQDPSWQITPDIWQHSEDEIVRLQPLAFPDLPSGIVHDLQKRGCTMPQAAPGSVGAAQPHNVIHGEFVRRGQKDWAVLCSRKKAPSDYDLYSQGRHYTIQRSWVSSIIVYFGGITESASEIGERYDMQDQVGLVESDGGKYVYRQLGYTRVLTAVDEEYILVRNDPATQYHPPRPPGHADVEITVTADALPPIDHQGIDDPFQEKASTVHYFSAGKWFALNGTD